MYRAQTQNMIRDLGHAAAVARALQPYVPAGKSLSRSAVAQWKRVPAEYVVALEEISGGRFRREDIRPDVFGQPPHAPFNEAA